MNGDYDVDDNGDDNDMLIMVMVIMMTIVITILMTILMTIIMMMMIMIKWDIPIAMLLFVIFMMILKAAGCVTDQLDDH